MQGNGVVRAVQGAFPWYSFASFFEVRTDFGRGWDDAAPVNGRRCRISDPLRLRRAQMFKLLRQKSSFSVV